MERRPLHPPLHSRKKHGLYGIHLTTLFRETCMEKPSTAIKLIAIDIDGTLLTPTGQITLRTRAAIEEARRAGIIVTLATARRYIGTMAVAAELGIELPLIVYDGAMVVSHPSRAILVSRTLSSDTARRAIEIFQRSHVQPVIHPCENGSCL